MRTELDIPLAAAEATEVFRRFPVRMSLPLVTVGLLSTCEIPLFRSQAQHPGGWTALWGPALWLLGYWAYCAAEAGTAAMYLKVRAGNKPSFRDVGRIVSKPRFNAVVRELLVRYIGWGLVWVVAGLLIFGVVQATRAVAHVPLATLVHPARITAELLLPFVIYRYTFVFPQFAIADGVGPDFVDRCVQQANRVRKLALLVAAVEWCGPLLLSPPERMLLHHFGASLTAGMTLNAATTVLVHGFIAWMVLLRTGLAQQLGPVWQGDTFPGNPMGSGEISPA